MPIYTILDCYTDEPAGLGVPPYLGVYPRYIYGFLDANANYLTIDDLRFYKLFGGEKKKREVKTDIRIKNLTRSVEDTKKILDKTTHLIIIAGVHTPGKYLSAIPGNLSEIAKLVKDFKFTKILTGPAASPQGSRLEGGKMPEKADMNSFNIIDENYFPINRYSKIREVTVIGAQVVRQIPWKVIAELETSHGCISAGCSFCAEKRHNLEFREQREIIAEARTLSHFGVDCFRLGKHSCFYSYKYGSPTEIENLLKPISDLKPKVLHIDNVNPTMVMTSNGEEVTKLIVKYCTEGNVAALGIESFDMNVIKENNLNCRPEFALKAIEIINKYGSEKGENGMPRFLPGLNLLFGLPGETKETHKKNMEWLQKIVDKGMLLRRINIRQVVPYEGTDLYQKDWRKVIQKNSKLYWKWREEIRQKIDLPMLRKMLPKGSILKDIYTEVHDGKHTFGRQFGSYPLIVGINKKIDLGKYYTVQIKDHMLRSVVGEVVKEQEKPESKIEKK